MPRTKTVVPGRKRRRKVMIARLQAMREAYMAARVRQIADAESSILALIEVERSKGVLAALRS